MYLQPVANFSMIRCTKRRGEAKRAFPVSRWGLNCGMLLPGGWYVWAPPQCMQGRYGANSFLQWHHVLDQGHVMHNLSVEPLWRIGAAPHWHLSGVCAASLEQEASPTARHACTIYTYESPMRHVFGLLVHTALVSTCQLEDNNMLHAGAAMLDEGPPNRRSKDPALRSCAADNCSQSLKN